MDELKYKVKIPLHLMQDAYWLFSRYESTLKRMMQEGNTDVVTILNELVKVRDELMEITDAQLPTD